MAQHEAKQTTKYTFKCETEKGNKAKANSASGERWSLHYVALVTRGCITVTVQGWKNIIFCLSFTFQLRPSLCVSCLSQGLTDIFFILVLI